MHSLACKFVNQEVFLKVWFKILLHQIYLKSFLTGGPAVKNPPTNAGDGGSIPGPGTKTPHSLELSTAERGHDCAAKLPYN